MYWQCSFFLVVKSVPNFKSVLQEENSESRTQLSMQLHFKRQKGNLHFKEE